VRERAARPPPAALQVRDSVHEHWSDLELRIAADKPAETVEVVAEDGSKVLGTRWRLQPVEVASTRPLAANGKVRHAVWCAGM
jgi:hypothetical protein